MEPTAESVFLDFSIRKFEQFLSRIRECVAKLKDEQIWARTGDHENAIGNLLLHLAGNMRQWIIAGIGGQPDQRVRDQEFAARGDIEAAELMGRLESTVTEALAVLKALPPDRLMETYQPQKYRVTILEGIYHVVEHFAQHTGQIIFATKLLTGQDLGFYKHLNRPAHAEKTP
jgi:uncharacterized damage-inducible protein DinB